MSKFEGKAKEATFLFERCASGRDSDDGVREEARRRARAWEEATKLPGSTFEDRLRRIGFDRDQFEAILQDDLQGSVEVRCNGTPDWIDFLEALDEGRLRTVEIPTADQMRPPEKTGRGSLAFESFLVPFLQYGVQRFRAAMQQPVGGDERSVVLSDEAEARLVGDLTLRLWDVCLPTLVLELNVARLRGELEGDTPEERFEYFSSEYFRDQETFVQLIDEYVVLGRLMVTTCIRWADAATEMIDRAHVDRERICQCFLDGNLPRRITGVKPGAGDVHRQGRSVCIIEFDHETTVVYKPGSQASTRSFFDLIDRLHALGLRHQHHTFTVIDQTTHGWAEYVEHRPCSDDAAVRRFYWRKGSLMAVLHVLMAMDFHYENVVAHGEHPVLVDLETLFHHSVGTKVQDAYTKALVELQMSVLRFAMLPFMTEDVSGDRMIDLSGLSGQGGQEVSSLRHAVAERTDEMRLTKSVGTTVEQTNRPFINGEAADLLAYRTSIVSGFRETYELIQTNRGTVAEAIRGFEGVPVRQLFRKTRQYNRYLKKTAHPNVLRAGLDRSQIVDLLWAKTLERPELAHIVQSEVEDVSFGEVPLFTTTPDSTDLWDSQGRRIEGFYDQDVLTQALQRLDEMSDRDCRRQIHLVRMALDALVPSGNDRPGKGGEVPQTKSADETGMREVPPIDSNGRHTSSDVNVLEQAALEIAEYLVTVAVEHDETMMWYGLNDPPSTDHAPERRRPDLAPLSSDVYNGTAGIGIFLAQVASVRDDDHLAAAALKTKEAVRRAYDRHLLRGVGVFTSRVGYAYMLTHTAAATDEQGDVDAAVDLIAGVIETIPRDEQYDVLSGTAGLALLAADLYDATGDPRALDCVDSCGRHLLAGEHELGWTTFDDGMPLPGYAHGLSGMAYSLLRIADVTGDEQYREAALRAISLERSTFDPDQGPWNHTKVAWCHGAPGLALGRIASAPYFVDQMSYDECEVAADLLQNRHPTDLGLCHGVVGNAVILSHLGRFLQDNRLATAAQQQARQVAQVVRGLRTRDDTRLRERPGLMCGLAGIGYGLLHLADTDGVPCVLQVDSGLKATGRPTEPSDEVAP